MAAILAAELLERSLDGGPSAAPSADGLADMRNVILEGNAKKHGGIVVRSSADRYLVSFDIAPRALKFAAAARARFAEYNRGRPADKRVALRVGVHVTPGPVSAQGVAEADAALAFRLLEAAPVGRVLLSRAAYEQAQKPRVCGFIALGGISLGGIEAPADAFEAVPLPVERLNS